MRDNGLTNRRAQWPCSRRQFLGAALGVSALSSQSLMSQPLMSQARRLRVAIDWRTEPIPAEFLKESLVFTRAYTCCPNREAAEWALQHGRFPHAAQDHEVSMWDFFDASDPEDADFVIATMHSADNDDWWAERSVRVPLAIQGRSLGEPRSTGVLCSHADVLPMLLRLANLAVPQSLQGQDVLNGPAREAVYVEGGLGTRLEWRALVRGYDKIVWTIAGPSPDSQRSDSQGFANQILGLYNVAEDPGESKDLQDQNGSRLTRDSMWALAERWMQRLEDGRDAHGFRFRGPA